MDTEVIRTLAILAVVVMGVPTVIFVFGPLARALGKRIAGPTLEPGDGSETGNAPLAERLAQTEGRLTEAVERLEETHQRLLEVEERLDFTERMLTRAKERERLGPGA